MNIAPYLEKRYPFVGLHPNPPDRSSDNGLLFSATYLVLTWDMDYAVKLYQLIEECRGPLAQFKRYPTDTNYTAHDDYVGILVPSYLLKGPHPALILECAIENGWTFGGRFFGRIPYFRPLVYAACGRRLSLFQQFMASLSYVGDCFSPREETSGRCLLYLMTKVFRDQGSLIKAALCLWRWRMTKMYPGGMRDVYSTYFTVNHPFALDGPKDFK